MCQWMKLNDGVVGEARLHEESKALARSESMYWCRMIEEIVVDEGL